MRVFPCPSVLEGGDCSSLILFRPNLEMPVTEYLMRHISKGPSLTPTCSCLTSPHCVSSGVSYRLSSVIHLPESYRRGDEVCRLTWLCFVFPPRPPRPAPCGGGGRRQDAEAGGSAPARQLCPAAWPWAHMCCSQGLSAAGGATPAPGYVRRPWPAPVPGTQSAIGAAVASRPGGHRRRPCPPRRGNVCLRLSRRAFGGPASHAVRGVLRPGEKAPRGLGARPGQAGPWGPAAACRRGPACRRLRLGRG